MQGNKSLVIFSSRILLDAESNKDREKEWEKEQRNERKGDDPVFNFYTPDITWGPPYES